MRVGVFVPHYNPGNAGVLRDFAAGISGHVGVHDDRHYVRCDIMVIFGLVKRSFRKSWAKGELLRRHSGPVIVIERGFVRRDEYWSVGIGGINGMADYANANSPDDRWRDLGVDMAPWRQGHDAPVIVCGQVPWDVTVQDTAHRDWVAAAIAAVRAAGRDPIFRPHPYAVKRGASFKVDAPVSIGPLARDIERAGLFVTYSSNTGVDAIIGGVPVIATAPMTMTRPISGRSFAEIARPPRPDRRQWAADIAYAQWNRAEMRSGAAWRHISRGFLGDGRYIGQAGGDNRDRAVSASARS